MSTTDRILITGASGFLGAAIADAARQRGFSVRALVRSSSPKANLHPDDAIATGDLLDIASLDRALRGVRFVIHAAADYRLWSRTPEALVATNVEGTRNLMKACLAAGVERVVVTSSVATLAPVLGGLADETNRLNPENAAGDYERSKILAERLVETMAVQLGLPAVIVEPSTIIGPRDIRPTPTGRMILAAARGRVPAYVDTGLTIAHVEDVAEGHLAALEWGKVGHRYVLGGDQVKLERILHEVARLTGRSPPRFRAPRALAYATACCAEFGARFTGREPLTTRTGVRLSRHYMYFNDAKARAELGYQSRPFEFALADAIRWFQSAGLLS